MNPLHFSRLADDLLEKSSAFEDEAGNVTISVAQYKTLMREAGWKQHGR